MEKYVITSHVDIFSVLPKHTENATFFFGSFAFVHSFLFLAYSPTAGHINTPNSIAQKHRRIDSENNNVRCT